MQTSSVVRCSAPVSECVTPCVVICSIYSGHHSILIPPSEVETNPALWLTAVSQHKVRDTFCSYGEETEVTSVEHNHVALAM